MYRVAIKESAIAHNAAVREFVDERGTTPEFDARQDAEAFVRSLTQGDVVIRLQAPSESDPAPVDAYLVRDGQCNEWMPVESDKPGTTFPVGGNIYGAIGVELIYLGGTPSPALTRYVADLGDAPDDARLVDVEREPQLPERLASEVGWRPDLGLTVAFERPATRETYYAEVKSGAASFQRSQRRDMHRVAEDHGVLKVRVDLAELPERYTVRIDAVGPDEWPT